MYLFKKKEIFQTFIYNNLDITRYMNAEIYVSLILRVFQKFTGVIFYLIKKYSQSSYYVNIRVMRRYNTVLVVPRNIRDTRTHYLRKYQRVARYVSRD